MASIPAKTVGAWSRWTQSISRLRAEQPVEAEVAVAVAASGTGSERSSGHPKTEEASAPATSLAALEAPSGLLTDQTVVVQTRWPGLLAVAVVAATLLRPRVKVAMVASSGVVEAEGPVLPTAQPLVEEASGQSAACSSSPGRALSRRP